MKRFTDEDVETLLRGSGRVSPPDGLASRIREEIPETLSVPSPKRAIGIERIVWLSAAAVAALSLAGVVWYSMNENEPESQPDVVASEPLPSPAEPGPAPVPPARAPVPGTKTAVLTEPARPRLGEVDAVVRDESGGVVPGATVTLTLKPTGTALSRQETLTTNKKGVARFRGLPPGDVSIRAELPGFAPDEVTASVSTGAARKLDITLRVAGVAESVRVTGESPIVVVSNTAIASSVASPAARGRGRWNRGYGTVPPTTGGTREPNDAPYDRVYFQQSGVNPFVDTEDDPHSTFGLDVDTGSYAIARTYIEDGERPDPDSIRVEEFVNYFDYDDSSPRKGDFAIHTEGAPTPFATTARTRLLRIGIRARDVDVDVDAGGRKPAVLTFLVDVSGSMDREDRLELVKKGLGFLLDGLRPRDEVGLVVFGSNARAVLEPTSDRDAIRRAVDELAPEGSTNLEEGLTVAYDMASRALAKGAINRVILCSDGVANEGSTGWESLLENVSRGRARSIELTTVGFGMGNYNDVLMEQLADHADGNYAYVDDVQEARRVFVSRLTGLMQTIARDAKVQVSFDPRLVESYRLLGYENRALADRDFEDDTKDAGEVGLGHHVTALYEVKLHERLPRRGKIATVRLRYRSVAAAESARTTQLEHDVDLADFSPSWESAPSSLRLAAVVAELAEVLRGSYWAREGSLEQVLGEARRLLPELSGNAEFVDFVSLVGKAAEIERDDHPR
jgi:Ca-activated chloride channel homolog